MKFNFKTLAAFCAFSTVMTGCSNDSTVPNGSSSSPLISTADETVSAETSAEKSETSAPAETNCTVTFSEEKITAKGSGAQASDNTVKITEAGVYEFSGKKADCKIYIEADKNAEITLLLNNAELTSKSGSVIDCESAKTLTIISKDGTKNYLCDSESYDSDDEADAAVFARSDLEFKGAGELNIEGKFGDAVKCKDALSIDEVTLTVNAADDGVTGKDSVTINGGTVNIISNGDGIKTTNDKDADKGGMEINGGELNITSAKDGIQSEKALTVKDGKITITAGGEAADAEIAVKDEPWDFDRKNSSQSDNSSETADSQKGIKSGGDLVINGGELKIKSADDSVHSGGNVEINGGTAELSSCDDGIHADGGLTVTSGYITVSKSYEGLEGKSIDISGGVIDITAADDGLNAAGGDNASFFGFGGASDDYYISVSGGEITVNSGGDGIDSNGTIAQSGGVITVYGPTNSGNGAIDYERSYAMSGGTLIALGSMGMAQAPSTLSQPCLSIYANAPANSKIEVRSESSVILETTTLKEAQSLIFSSDKLKADADYGIYVNDELAETVTATDGVSGSGATGGGDKPGGFDGKPNGFGGNPGGFGDPSDDPRENRGEKPGDINGSPNEVLSEQQG